MSGQVTLRPIVEADWPALFEQYSDPDATAMAGMPTRSHQEFMAHRARITADPTTRNRAVLLDGDLVGDVVSWVPENGPRMVGYWIDKRYWGRGIATAALRAFVAELPERPLYANLLRTNLASLRVLEKCGFRPVAGDELGNEPDPKEHLLRLDR